MSRHRAEPPRRHAAPPPGHRRAATVRPRYGRLAVLGASLSVTGIAMLGGVGVLPSVASDSGDGSDAGRALAGASTTPSASPSSTASVASAPAGTSKQQLGAQPSATHATPTVEQ